MFDVFSGYEYHDSHAYERYYIGEAMNFILGKSIKYQRTLIDLYDSKIEYKLSIKVNKLSVIVEHDENELISETFDRLDTYVNNFIQRNK